MKSLSQQLNEAIKSNKISKLTVAQVKSIVDAAAEFADYDNNSTIKGDIVTYDDYEGENSTVKVHRTNVTFNGAKISFDEFIDVLTGSDDYMRSEVLSDAGIK